MKRKLPASLIIIIISYFLVSLALIATSASYSEILVDTFVFYTGLIFLVFSVLLWVGLSRVRMIAIVLSSLLGLFMITTLMLMILGKMTVTLTLNLESLSLPVGMAIIYTSLLLLISFMIWQLRALFSHEVKEYFHYEKKEPEEVQESSVKHHAPKSDGDEPEEG